MEIWEKLVMLFKNNKNYSETTQCFQKKLIKALIA